MRANRPSLTARWSAPRRAAPPWRPRARRHQRGTWRASEPSIEDVSRNVTFNVARPSGVNHRARSSSTPKLPTPSAAASNRSSSSAPATTATGPALRRSADPLVRGRLSQHAGRQAPAAGCPGRLAGGRDLRPHRPDARRPRDSNLEARRPRRHRSDALPLAEGLVQYLTLEATATMFEALRDAGGAWLRARRHLLRVARATHDLLLAWYRARDVFFRAIGEPRRGDYRPDDPEKLYVVTGWRVARSRAGPPVASTARPG